MESQKIRRMKRQRAAGAQPNMLITKSARRILTVTNTMRNDERSRKKAVQSEMKRWLFQTMVIVQRGG